MDENFDVKQQNANSPLKRWLARDLYRKLGACFFIRHFFFQSFRYI